MIATYTPPSDLIPVYEDFLSYQSNEWLEVAPEDWFSWSYLSHLHDLWLTEDDRLGGSFHRYLLEFRTSLDPDFLNWAIDFLSNPPPTG